MMQVKYKTYEKYKDSGIPWIGDIPNGWDVKKLKYISNIKSSNIDKHDKNKIKSYVINYNDVIKESAITNIEGLERTSCTKQQFESFSLKFGDIIATKDSMDAKNIADTAIIEGNIDENLVCGYHLYIIRFDSYLFKKYFFYLLSSQEVKKYFLINSKGTTIIGLGNYAISNINLVVPPIAEQRKIAEFLDQKTAEIDAAIKNKERLVELLKEQKDIIINDAVTKGLNPKVKMKESGIEWIGKIPEHWEVLPGRVCLKSKQVSNKGLKVKTVLSLSYGSIVIKPEEKLHGLVPESFETYQIVCPGDIIVRVMDLQNDHTSLRIGLVKDHGIITSAYVCLEMGEKMESYYSYLYLHNLDILKVFYGMGSGLRQNLSYVDFKYLQVLVPPSNEQKEIISFVKEIETKTEELIRNTKNEIEKLKEFRKTLISHAVTGKIKI